MERACWHLYVAAAHRTGRRGPGEGRSAPHRARGSGREPNGEPCGCSAASSCRTHRSRQLTWSPAVSRARPRAEVSGLGPRPSQIGHGEGAGAGPQGRAVQAEGVRVPACTRPRLAGENEQVFAWRSGANVSVPGSWNLSQARASERAWATTGCPGSRLCSQECTRANDQVGDETRMTSGRVWWWRCATVGGSLNHLLVFLTMCQALAMRSHL